MCRVSQSQLHIGDRLKPLPDAITIISVDCESTVIYNTNEKPLYSTPDLLMVRVLALYHKGLLQSHR